MNPQDLLTIAIATLPFVVTGWTLLVRLRPEIDRLAASLDRLAASIDRLDVKLDDHGERLARLEALEEKRRR